MIYKSAKSPRLLFLMGLCEILIIGIAVMTFIYFDTFVKYLLVIFEAFVAVVIAAGIFNTCYELRDDSLYMQSGFLHSEIKYSEIKTVARTRGYSFFMALAINRLEINAGNNESTGKIVLSPENEDDFLEQLSKRCPGMTITQ